jgi:hypothetical protein
MRLFRPLFLSLLIASGVSQLVAPLAAQSSTDKPAASSPLLPALPPNPQTSADFLEFVEFVQPLDGGAVPLLPTVPSAGKDDSQDMFSKNFLRRRIMTLEENQPVCYMLRTYRVARESPDSDSTRPAGYSTCQRASRFQFKTAVDTREIAPR